MVRTILGKESRRIVGALLLLVPFSLYAQVLDDKLSFTAELNLSIPFNPSLYPFLKKTDFDFNTNNLYSDTNENILRQTLQASHDSMEVKMAWMQFLIVKGYYSFLSALGPAGTDDDVCISTDNKLERGTTLRFKDDPPDTLCKLRINSGLKSVWGGIIKKAEDSPLVAEGMAIAEQMMREAPDKYAEPYLAIGFVKTVAGNFEEARTLMGTGLKLENLHSQLAVPYAAMLTFEASQTGKSLPIDKIREMLEPVYQQKNLDRGYYMALARVYYLLGRYPDALEVLEKVKTKNSDEELNLNLALGLTYSRMGKNPDAIKVLLKAKKLASTPEKKNTITWALDLIQ
ncbi:tetratricopeptide repeat protein [bacterium]|nr:tetratricopeptide repeat protein [bacterium]